MRDTVYQNLNGKVYFVGDIHGQYDAFMDSLEAVSFDLNKDLVICTGDLIDRGPDSLKALGLIEKPWFKAVKGNHEQIALRMIELMNEGDYGKVKAMTENWIKNGGEWFILLSKDDLRYMLDEGESLIKSLPTSLTVKLANGKDIGVIHANPLPGSWLNSAYSNISVMEENHILWDRSRARAAYGTQIKNVESVCVGHSVVEPGEKQVKGNVVHIDHGSWRSGAKFKLYDSDEILQLTKSPCVENQLQSKETSHGLKTTI